MGSLTTSSLHYKTWLTASLIFGLALAVRLPGLGSFATADEPYWIERSRWFTVGLFFPDIECPPAKDRPTSAHGLTCTLQSSHPGIMTVWSGSLGLLLYHWQLNQPTGPDLRTFLQTFPVTHQDARLLSLMRLPLAILAALFVMALYLLLREMLSEAIAVTAALLIGLHPFHVALSRVLHHDAVNTTFMILSALALIGYGLQSRSWPWLIFSGVMAGLAFLSKVIGLFLLPYAGLVGGLSWLYGHRSWGKLLLAGFMWISVASLTFSLFFPAMWVVPQQVMAVVFDQNFAMVDRGHNHYFLGQVSDDPGWLFYPLGWLWQAAPLELLGLLLLPFVIRGKSIRHLITSRPVELTLILFVIFLAIMETASDKKMVRYFLPGFVMLNILAAYGLIWFSRRLLAVGQKFLSIKSPNDYAYHLLSLIILVVHGSLLWQHRPYYFTYYNPVVGGAPVAADIMTVGWGEGLEQAAAYLNQLPNVSTLRVASWYNDIFQPYFVGQTVSFADDGRAQLSADYVVFYISQVQRQKPYPGLIDYFQMKAPVFTVAVPFAGRHVDWVAVYPAPAAHSLSGPPDVEGIGQLLAYRLTGELTPNQPDHLTQPLTLFFRAFGPLPPETTFGVALRDPAGHLWGEWQAPALKAEWQPGKLVEWPGQLILPADLPPTAYRLWVAFQFETGDVIAEFPIADKEPPLMELP